MGIVGVLIFIILLSVLAMTNIIRDVDLVANEGTYYSISLFKKGIFLSTKDDNEIEISKNTAVIFYEHERYIYYKEQQVGNIYRINRIDYSENQVLDYCRSFKVTENKLYYINEDDELHRSDLDGRNSEELFGEPISEFRLEGESIIVRSILDGKYYRIQI